MRIVQSSRRKDSESREGVVEGRIRGLPGSYRIGQYSQYRILMTSLTNIFNLCRIMTLV